MLNKYNIKSLLQLVVMKSPNCLLGTKSTKFHLKECNRYKLIKEGPSILMDISYSSCMPFNTIYSAHIAVLLQYIKPSESTLYLSKGSSKTMVLLPGANIELTSQQKHSFKYNSYQVEVVHLKKKT